MSPIQILFDKLDKLISLQQKHLDLLTNEQVIIPAKPDIINTDFKHIQATATQDAMVNRKEAEEFGEDMSAQELANMFGEEYVPEKEVDFSKMTKEEIDEWQKSKDDSTDIYKVKARVINLARESGAGITPNGEAMINTYVHVLMAFYSFAEKITDRKLKKEFIELIKSKEGFPGDVINVTLQSRRK